MPKHTKPQAQTAKRFLHLTLHKAAPLNLVSLARGPRTPLNKAQGATLSRQLNFVLAQGTTPCYASCEGKC